MKRPILRIERVKPAEHTHRDAREALSAGGLRSRFGAALRDARARHRLPQPRALTPQQELKREF